LRKKVHEGRFREDLFFRLNVFPVRLRPLRERRTQIPLLAEYLGGKTALRLGYKKAIIPTKCMNKLTAYDWPGNVRELQNVLERALILSRGGELDFRKVLFEEDGLGETCRGTLSEIEKQAIVNGLRQTEGNRKKAAAMLGISLRALQYKIKSYGISRDSV